MPEPSAVVVWTVAEAEADLAADRLWQAGATAVQMKERGTLVAGFPTPDAARTVAAELGAQAETIEAWEDTWREETWRDEAAPVEVAPGLVVAPAWKPMTAADGLTLLIDPGPCFGSGSHPSTRQLLAALADELPAGRRVLDVGTGSGILAVAAARLGATEVVAVDIDECAVSVTAANAARNGVADRVHPSTTPVEALHGAFPLILVNVTAGVHAAVGPHLAQLGGRLLLAGLLPGQWRHVAAAYPGCTVTGRSLLDGWEMLRLIR